MLLHAMALFILFLLLSQLAALAGPGSGRRPTSRQVLLLTAGQLLAHTVLLAASLLVARPNFRHGLRRGLGLSLRRWRTDLLRGLVAYLVVVPACVGLIALMNYLWPDLQQTHQILQWILPSPWPVQVLLAASAVLVAPVAEEVYFRGILQTSIRNLTRSKWSAILIASGIFAVVHGIVLHWPPLFVLSLALGYNYERTGRLLPSIVLHAVFNGVIVAMTLSAGPGGSG
jgi:membrane protease YdiL (CAAX protease family)